jgi:hypothetical protein
MAPPSSSEAVGQTKTPRDPDPFEPLDLDALLAVAESGEGDRAVISRAWLRRAHLELTAARAAHAALARAYGGLPR